MLVYEVWRGGCRVESCLKMIEYLFALIDFLQHCVQCDQLNVILNHFEKRDQKYQLCIVQAYG